MRKTFGCILGLACLCVFPLIAAQPVFAATTYYVATTGSDTNAGTLSAPFQTIQKGVSVLSAGDTLAIEGGTYTKPVTISANGSAESPITITNYNNQSVAIDIQSYPSATNNVSVTGNYVVVNGMEIRNNTSTQNGYCVNLQGSHNTIQNSLVHDCYNHAIYTDGTYETIANNTVYHATTINSALTMTSGWGSGIKVHASGQNITIAGNTVYNNYGEGIAVTRGAYVNVIGNTAYDNYSVNIYVDNSYNVLVARNFAYKYPNNVL